MNAKFDPKVRMIPVSQINILNPRGRSKKKFAQIVSMASSPKGAYAYAELFLKRVWSPCQCAAQCACPFLSAPKYFTAWKYVSVLTSTLSGGAADRSGCSIASSSSHGPTSWPMDDTVPDDSAVSLRMEVSRSSAPGAHACHARSTAGRSLHAQLRL